MRRRDKINYPKVKVHLALTFILFVTFVVTFAVHADTMAEACPTNITGHWVGAYGTPEAPYGAIVTDFTNPSWNNQLTGVFRYSFGNATWPFDTQGWPEMSWDATINCNTWSGLAGGSIDFVGTISPDGNTIIGTYGGGTGHAWLVRQSNGPAEVAISDTTIMEGDPGTTRTDTVAVTLTNPSTQAVTVTYRIDHVDADGQDADCRKCGANQKVTFPLLSTGKTATSKNIPIRVWGDSIPEGDEKLKVTIVSASGVSGIVINDAFVTIKNDD